ncbi:META domain-containing protein [Candidatus Mycolicibacterium alkanivorans]|uniref:META domain-containing protein n=1 Tax=Candidatus Mycolicibacterium alkanivorans TaxID=2954114 RepID=A0ABS9YX84_9MYCO|nr:META domain-containing protein [Candidatus Mycolicibacterium alkanivorans]MCI4675454.1 META domain-containing protein [Candidatus Mycolicibacterium alkanivorans]
MRVLWLLGSAVLALAACGSTPPAPHPLGGTSWRLLSLESMNDEQGTTAVDDPSRYTVEFGTDGRAAFRIDCNRGTSTWQASAASPDSGSLSFGPIATTRMACPQPSLENQVSTALGYVRGFLIKDGLLHMSLLADGAVLHWEPDHKTGGPKKR